MSNLFVELPPLKADAFKVICSESGFDTQVFYPQAKGAARRVYVRANAQDFGTLKALFAEQVGTEIL